MKIDHLVLNVGKSFQQDRKEIKSIREAGFPYLPSSGLRTKGVRVTELLVGTEYLELVRFTLPSGGPYRKEWGDAYGKGHRGLIGLLLQTDDLDRTYADLSSRYVPVTRPEKVQYKWFFDLLPKTVPWRVSYIPLLFGFPLQIGILERKHPHVMDPRKPNSIEHGIKGIREVTVQGPFTDGDLKLLPHLFPSTIEKNGSLVALLDGDQRLVFEKRAEVRTSVRTQCKDASLQDSSVAIENVTLFAG
jgi:hypothetical protein